MIAEETKTLLSGVVTHLPDLFIKGKSDSLTEFTRPTRNDFLTLVESDLITLDYLPMVLDRAQSLVAGYFLSAVTLLVDVPEINVRRTLDTVSTSRDPIESILGSGSAMYKFVGTESFDDGLPNLDSLNGGSIAAECFALEAYNSTASGQALVDEQTIRRLNITKLRGELEKEYGKATINTKIATDVAKLSEIDQRIDLANQKNEREKLSASEQKKLNDAKFKWEKERGDIQAKLQKEGLDIQRINSDLAADKFTFDKEQSGKTLELQKDRLKFDKEQAAKQTGSVGFGRNTLATIDELSNLSTGKTLDVEFERNGNRATVPVTIRLAVTDTDPESMKAIISTASITNTFSDRWRRMRNGELSMVKDLFFCHDLIAESRRARVRDKSGFFDHMMRRRSKNFLSGLFSLTPSINNASAVLIVSHETATKASFELGGDLNNFKIREKVFKSTAAMLIFVIDTKWDTVTIYHRGIDVANELSARDLKRGVSGNDGGVDDIINAYQAGSVPTL